MALVHISLSQITVIERGLPDGLVGNDDLGPVADLLLEGGELGGDDLEGLAGNEGVVLLQDGATLGVTDEGPCDTAVLQLLGRDLTGESTVGLVVDVLGGDLDTLAEVLAGKEKVESRRSNNDLC